MSREQPAFQTAIENASLNSPKTIAPSQADQHIDQAAKGQQMIEDQSHDPSDAIRIGNF